MKKLLILKTLLVCLLFANVGYSQTFLNEYGTSSTDEGGATMCELSSGNILLAGYHEDASFLMEVSPGGNIIWTEEVDFIPAVPDRIRSVKLANDGNLIGCGGSLTANGSELGSSRGPNGDGDRGFAFKYDLSTRSFVWIYLEDEEGLENPPNVFNADKGTYYNEILEMPATGNWDGDFVLIGGISNNHSADRRTEGLVTRLDQNGGFVWQSAMLDNDPSGFNSVIEWNGEPLATGRFAIGGSESDFRAALVNLPHVAPSAGFSADFFNAAASSNARLYPNDLVRNPASGNLFVIIGGDPNGTSTNYSTIIVELAPASGQIPWSIIDADVLSSNTFGSLRGGELLALPGGDLIIMGRGTGSTNKIYLARFSPSTGVVWAKTFGNGASSVGYGFDYYQNQVILSGSHLYFTGESTLAGDTQVLFGKIDLNGNLNAADFCVQDLVMDVNPGDQEIFQRNVNPAGIHEGNTNPTVGNTSLTFDTDLSCSPPCPLLDAGNFTLISSNTTITQDEVWEGKYYFSPGVELTVDGALLDLTNVDIVFDECSGINFVNSATLQANNSVFRTCDPLKSWHGFEFTESEGSLDECTFINADAGLHIQGFSQVRVTNNLFDNCNFGVYVTDQVLNENISGNTFAWDESPITYNNFFNASCIASTGISRVGVFIGSASIQGLISQNDFIYLPDGDSDFEGVGVYGIYASGGTISNNTFTNLQRSLNLFGSSAFSFEGNEIEVVSSTDTREEFQVRISDGSFDVEVTDNEFRVADQNQGNVFNESAIYVDNAYNIDIQRNRMRGFQVGIQGHEIMTSSILENTIDYGGKIGIFVEDAATVEIACNTVNMSGRSGSAGIEYFVNDPAFNSAQIRSNCIFDSEYGMILFSYAANAQMPEVRNNFLYNYTSYGIQINDFSGSIGTGISSATDAGRNTFVCNNIPNGAIDISSSPNFITAYGNYGISTANGVTLVGNDQYNSTAACGIQIGTVSSELDDFSECTNSVRPLPLMTPVAGGQMELVEGFEDRIAEMGPMQGEILPGLLWNLMGSGNSVEALKIVHYAQGLNKDSEFLFNQLSFIYALGQDDFEEAGRILSNATRGDWRVTAGIILDLKKEDRDLLSLSEEEKSTLSQVLEPHGGQAWEILNFDFGGRNFPFKEAEVPSSPIQSGTSILQNYLKVFPNPGTDELNLEFCLTEGVGEVKIYDISGNLVYEQEVNENLGKAKVDCHTMRPGLYLVVLSDDGQLVETVKWIKK